MIEALLEYPKLKININDQDIEGNTLLHYCIEEVKGRNVPHNRDAMMDSILMRIKALLDKEADPTIKNKKDQTPLELGLCSNNLGNEFIQKIEGGWVDVDVVIATPSVMPKIGKLGKVLGPRNLMPNPKTGTVTNDVAAAVTEVKGGKIAFKVDKAGIIHASIGRVSFAPEKIAENSQELLNAIIKAKPSSAKGAYLRGISMASSMSPGISIDTRAFVH